MSVRWLGASNVHWCEAEVELYRHSGYVAEFWNTASTLALVIVGALGVRRCARMRLPASFAFTQSMLVVVGFGSMLFHATQTWVGEVLDEMPMCFMALGYMWCLDGMHALTRGAARRVSYACIGGLAAVACVCYLALHKYWIFTTLFTIQLAVPALVSLTAADKLGGVFSARRWQWWMSLVSIGTARALWEWERWLYRARLCPVSPLDPRFWLHPAWHVLSSIAPAFWFAYVERVRRAEGPDVATDRKFSKMD